MKNHRYRVSTRVLIDQAKTLGRQLEQDIGKERLAALGPFGLPSTFAADLKSRTEALATAEGEQERLKAAYTREAREDRAIAEEGYRYKLAIDARARAHIAQHGDELDLPGRLRFGKLKSARARGVVYELRVVLPEVAALKDQLADVGITTALVEKGWDILKRLGVDQAETAEAKAEREAMTKQVRDEELATTRLLDLLLATDEAYVLGDPEAEPLFRLDLIRAEQARVQASRATRVAARPADPPSFPDDE